MFRLSAESVTLLDRVASCLLAISRNAGVLAVAASLSMNTVHAGNWPSWRGPTGNGISAEKNVPVTWSATENVAWKTSLPGPAGSTPVVWDHQIFLTSVTADDDLVLMCIGDDGKEQWKLPLSHGNKQARGDEGNSASPSPVTDGSHVWAFFGDGVLACVTIGGEVVWKYNVQDIYGKFNIQFGMSSTPVLEGDVLYMQLIHGDGDPKTHEARIVALNKLTGKELWAIERPSDGKDENEHSYASPIIYRDPDHEYLVTHGGDYTIGHRLNDGKEMWRMSGLNPHEKYDSTLRFVASPAAVPGLLVIPTAKRGPVMGIRPRDGGDLLNTDAHLWTSARTPDVPSPLIHDGIVYLCMEDGNLKALDAKDGKELYFQRGHRQRHRASPVYANGHLYLTARDGHCTVVKTGREFEIVADNELPETISASPAFANDTIYFRTFDSLYALRKAAKSE